MDDKELAEKIYDAHYESVVRFDLTFVPFEKRSLIFRQNWIELARKIRALLSFSPEEKQYILGCLKQGEIEYGGHWTPEHYALVNSLREKLEE